MDMITLANGVEIDAEEYGVNSIVKVIAPWTVRGYIECLLVPQSIVLFNDDGTIEDIAENWETASSIINQNSGVAGYVVDETNVTFMDAQAMCDHEHDMRVDCFGI